MWLAREDAQEEILFPKAMNGRNSLIIPWIVDKTVLMHKCYLISVYFLPTHLKVIIIMLIKNVAKPNERPQICGGALPWLNAMMSIPRWNLIERFFHKDFKIIFDMNVASSLAKNDKFLMHSIKFIRLQITRCCFSFFLCLILSLLNNSRKSWNLPHFVHVLIWLRFLPKAITYVRAAYKVFSYLFQKLHNFDTKTQTLIPVPDFPKKNKHLQNLLRSRRLVIYFSARSSSDLFWGENVE